MGLTRINAETCEFDGLGSTRPKASATPQKGIAKGIESGSSVSTGPTGRPAYAGRWTLLGVHRFRVWDWWDDLPAARGTGGTTNRRGDAKIATADEPRINDRIRAREVFLIAEDGEKLGPRTVTEALAIAIEQGLDLVEVAPSENPPVCRIMDYSRWQYEQQQKRKESRRKATNVVIKEMKYRPKIDGHDYATKTRKVLSFLNDGNKVKVTIMFRGREMAHPELGRKILDRIAEDVIEVAMVEMAPRQDGRNMTMVLNPSRRKPKPAKPRTEVAPTEVAPVEAKIETEIASEVLTESIPAIIEVPPEPTGAPSGV